MIFLYLVCLSMRRGREPKRVGNLLFLNKINTRMKGYFSVPMLEPSPMFCLPHLLLEMFQSAHPSEDKPM